MKLPKKCITTHAKFRSSFLLRVVLGHIINTQLGTRRSELKTKLTCLKKSEGNCLTIEKRRAASYTGSFWHLFTSEYSPLNFNFLLSPATFNSKREI